MDFLRSTQPATIIVQSFTPNNLQSDMDAKLSSTCKRAWNRCQSDPRPPKREPVRMFSPWEFNVIIDALAEAHCDHG
jgi:hypothetical protein